MLSEVFSRLSRVLRGPPLGRLARYGAHAGLLVGLFRGPGCGESATASGFNAGDATEPAPSAGSGQDDGTTNFAEQDAAVAPPAVYRGNPLCKVTAGTCMPDDDGQRTGSGTQPCAELASDGGTTVSSGPACRLTRLAGASQVPSCETGTHAGTDGASCARGEDCAPGFDCVEAGGVSQCRHYCCQDTCSGASTQSGSATFCDVQKLVDTSEHAPVCMPLKPCTLLATDQCAVDETCAVVTPGGATGCVSVGKAKAGDACDQSHCAAGLTCIGQVGTRRCYQLCKVGQDATCADGQVCKTSTVFSDPSFGVCQKSM